MIRFCQNLKMALNTSHAAGGVLIFNAERILIYYDGVEMSFDMDGHLPHFKGNKKGKVYLTTHRVIFNCTNKKDSLQSFSMPFHFMKQVELEQPVFGANYIKGKVQAEPGGNWEGNGKWKMWFNKGGAIEFGQAMLHAGRLATRNRPAQPPVYTAAPQCNYYQAPPPAYSPPQGQTYSFVPYETFPNAPPTNGVYMMDAPPPYPGVDPNLTPYGAPPAGFAAAAPPPQQPMSSADSKAAEAQATAAYYNPANPSTVYIPQQPPQGGYAPPPENPGYPPQQNGYAPSPQQPGYPPQNGYAPPQQQPGYPPQNGYALPQQQPGYPPQQQPSYPPQNGYAPPPQGAGGYAPPPADASPAYDELQKKTQ